MAPVLETGISIPGTSYREMQKMDKYEFNIKVEQIKKMVSRGDYETAMTVSYTHLDVYKRQVPSVQR